MKISGMETWRHLGRKKKNPNKIHQYLGPREKNDGKLYAPNPQLEGTQFQQAVNPDS